MLLAGIAETRPPVGDGVLRIAAVAGAHDAVARLHALHLAADGFHLAGELQPEHGTWSAGAAVHVA
jgi:hypothetical protein